MNDISKWGRNPQIHSILFKTNHRKAMILLSSPYCNMARQVSARMQAYKRAHDSVPVLRSVSEPRDLVYAVHRSLLGVAGFLGHRIVERWVVLGPTLSSVVGCTAEQRK